MNSCGGALHQGSFEADGQSTGCQLRVAIPPGIKDGEAFGQYVLTDDVQEADFHGCPFRVLLGKREFERVLQNYGQPELLEPII